VNGQVTHDLRRVQLRTTAITAVVLVGILVVGAVGLVTFVERETLHQIDERLLDTSDYVASVGRTEERFPPVDDVRDAVQVIGSDGEIVFASPALEEQPPLWTPGDPVRDPHTVTDGQGLELRISAVPFRDRWVVFAEPLITLDENATTLRKAMLLGLAPLTLLLAGIAWIVIGRILRPVATAVDREERFVADASHELRNPIAGVRVLLETMPHDLTDAELSRIEALAAVGRLETITDQLLTLTRHGQQASPAPVRPVDLDEILHEQLACTPIPPEIHVDSSEIHTAQVLAHEGDLARLVQNLLTNACRHAASTIRVTLTEDDRTVHLCVDDDGPGIPAADRDRAFERFTRLDRARTRADGGTGLGLAICRAVVDAHHGTIAAKASVLGGARLHVSFPSSTAAAPKEPGTGRTRGRTVS
jgi:signal transduction histidine kinase